MFQALEDNQVKLSTMKASRFVKAFETDVDHWERTLSLILEVVEMLLTVQRQWMYLEVSGKTNCSPVPLFRITDCMIIRSVSASVRKHRLPFLKYEMN